LQSYERKEGKMKQEIKKSNYQELKEFLEFAQQIC
jgi:hypothetical protein